MLGSLVDKRSSPTVRKGVIVRDNLAKIVIDAPDSLSNRRWMKQYKDRWRLKLEQTELWMVSHAVEVE